MKNDYIERMKAELKALNHSIEKIESFVQEGKYQDLTEEEFHHLNCQFDHMESYSKILAKRITLAEEKECKRVVFTVKVVFKTKGYNDKNFNFDNIKDAFIFIDELNSLFCNEVLKVSLKSNRKG